MSASAVRGGQVYVEIGANPSKLLNALRIVNTQVGNLGTGIASVGMKMSMAGSAIAAPIMAAGMAFAENNAEVNKAGAALNDLGKAVGHAVAPAIVGVSKAIGGMATAAAKFVRENEGLVRTIVGVGGAVAGVGVALVGFGRGLALVSSVAGNIYGPLVLFGKTLLTVGGALITIAASAPVLALAGIIGGIGLAANAAGVDLGKMAGKLGTAFSAPIGDARKLFGELYETATITIDGIYNAIAAGDIGGAVEIMWAGVKTAWLRGQGAVMNVLDPWVSFVQNTFDYLATNVVGGFDQLNADAAKAVLNLSAVLSNLFGNLADGVVNTFDLLVAEVKKAWARVQAMFTGAKDTKQRIEAIDNERQAKFEERRQRRADRGTQLSDAVAVVGQEADARQRDRAKALEDRMAGRENANRQRATDRAAAVAEATAALRVQVSQTAAPPEMKLGASTGGAISGTFSAFGLDQMSSGGVQKQQLDELRGINRGVERLLHAGGIIP